MHTYMRSGFILYDLDLEKRTNVYSKDSEQTSWVPLQFLK